MLPVGIRATQIPAFSDLPFSRGDSRQTLYGVQCHARGEQKGGVPTQTHPYQGLGKVC